MTQPLLYLQPLLFIDEVAALARVSSGTVRHWILTGKLRSVRPGRRRMVHRSDVDEFLGFRAGGSVAPVPSNETVRTTEADLPRARHLRADKRSEPPTLGREQANRDLPSPIDRTRAKQAKRRVGLTGGKPGESR